MAAEARELKSELSNRFRDGDRSLMAVQQSLAAALGREISAEEAADHLIQGVACATPILASTPHASEVVSWIGLTAVDWERWILERALDSSGRQSVVDAIECRSVAHFYEPFLQLYSATTRRRTGVFFTPRPIADFIIRQIDGSLRDDLGLSDGIASIRTPPIAFLDPACGTGVFLLALIDHWQAKLGDQWPALASEFMSRLSGIEVLPAAAILAKLNVAIKLLETGVESSQPLRIDIRLGNALSGQCAIQNRQSTIPVVFGNPPFSSLSTNSDQWITRLVSGDQEVRGYVRAGDLHLGERKTWLHDDYVKFIRLGQWIVEQAGCGIVAYVTNHGYLDNLTFRLMRHELLRVFDRIQIVDLHGNRKKGEIHRGDSRDENVFGLDQGIAIATFTRTERRSAQVRTTSESRVEYSELWGGRSKKLDALDERTAVPRRLSCFSPAPPHWQFIPQSRKPIHDEYANAWPLNEAMPVNAPAPVTARDHFVVGYSAQELIDRIAEFRDLSISDEVIQSRYFTRTRSSRYTPGDTRSWKLAEARRIVAADENWRHHIRRCLYRPFDWRYVFWHSAMIDWPRTGLTRHVLTATNYCLIARRQQLPSQPCTYFWISDGLALDGVIRSDNRGSESLFPLYLGENGPDRGEVANFEPTFLQQMVECAEGDCLAEDVLAYIYAIFHSPTYRQRCADQLRSGFPRVLLPAKPRLFHELSAFGRQLMELHLLRQSDNVAALRSNDYVSTGDEDIDQFRVGGYQVLTKWLKGPHRQQSDQEYQRIRKAIDWTITLMRRIDSAIDQHGGFPTAFVRRLR